MRIFHGLHNIGGMAGIMAEAQRAIGAQASSYCFPTGNYRFKSDHEITGTDKPSKMWSLAKIAGKSFFNYDVFQFYFGESLAGPLLTDVPILKALGKKIYFYFCGCDIRDSKATIQKYEYSACQECWPMGCSANRSKALQVALDYADGIFVSTPDLLEFVPGAILLPQPLNLDTFKSLRDDILSQKKSEDSVRKIIIAHAPSSRQIKGTRYVEAAIAELQAAGVPVELKLIENLSYEEALQQSASADIVIDQLLIGAYGQYAVEMMALGKPVICYLRDDLRPHYSNDLPIVSANPKSLSSVIKDLIDLSSSWNHLGELGQKYVNDTHCSKIIATKTVKIYSER